MLFINNVYRVREPPNNKMNYYKLLNMLCLESYIRGIPRCENKKITLKNNIITYYKVC